MQFVLTGFTPETGFRVFAFEGIAADRTRTEFTVRTDLALVRRYGIQMQELPLLCRGLLERRGEGAAERTLTFPEEEMQVLANIRATELEAALKKKLSRRPPTNQNGSASRTQPGVEDARVAGEPAGL